MSIRSNHPFPPRGRGVHYFEVEILPTENPPTLETWVGIGLCGEFVDMSYGFPGSYAYNPSAGYHGDDGNMYESFLLNGLGRSTGKTYGEGDTVGCGINWSKNSVYYTLNGKLVGAYYEPVDPSSSKRQY